MASNDDLERVKAHMRRWGRPEKPAAQLLVSEVRSQDFFPLKTRDPGRDYLVDTIMILWTFGTPKARYDEVNSWLRDNEAALCRVTELTATEMGAETVAYRGTYWSVGTGRYCYTTIWAYADAESIDRFQGMYEGLDKQDAFKVAYDRLRGYWEDDPGREEQRFEAAALLAQS